MPNEEFLFYHLASGAMPVHIIATTMRNVDVTLDYHL